MHEDGLLATLCKVVSRRRKRQVQVDVQGKRGSEIGPRASRRSPKPGGLLAPVVGRHLQSTVELIVSRNFFFLYKVMLKLRHALSEFCLYDTYLCVDKRA